MKKVISSLFICSIFIILLVKVSFAAFNPFLTVKIDNMDTTNYIVDLLVNNSKKEYKKANEEDKKEENDIFQNIQKEYDEWVLANYYGEYVDKIKGNKEDPFLQIGEQEYVKYFRSVYFGQYVGNENFYHEFYANDDGSGPSRTATYKIILINKDTGEVKISKEIKNNKNNNLTIDAKTMKIFSKENVIHAVKIVVIILVIILLVIAVIYKFVVKKKL